MKTTLQDFPFSECCAYLHTNSASRQLDPGRMTTNHRNTLLSWVGHVAHGSLTAEQTLVRNAISRYVNTRALRPMFQQTARPAAQNDRPPTHNGGSYSEQGGPSTQLGNPSRQNGGWPGQARRQPTQNENTSRQDESPGAQNGVPLGLHVSPPVQQDLSKYTSLLKEYGDYHSEKPNWVERDISTNDHPRFSCRLTFHGVTAEGTGRQKKYARHEASFNACRQLGLELASGHSE